MKFEKKEMIKSVSDFNDGTVFTINGDFPTLRGRGKKIVDVKVFTKTSNDEYAEKPEEFTVDAFEFQILRDGGFHMLTREDEKVIFTQVIPA